MSAMMMDAGELIAPAGKRWGFGLQCGPCGAQGPRSHRWFKTGTPVGRYFALQEYKVCYLPYTFSDYGRLALASTPTGVGDQHFLFMWKRHSTTGDLLAPITTPIRALSAVRQPFSGQGSWEPDLTPRVAGPTIHQADPFSLGISTVHTETNATCWPFSSLSFSFFKLSFLRRIITRQLRYTVTCLPCLLRSSRCPPSLRNDRCSNHV